MIYDELCQGVIRDGSRVAYQSIIAGLADEGAESVILGCTEIGLLISPADSPLRSTTPLAFTPPPPSSSR